MRANGEQFAAYNCVEQAGAPAVCKQLRTLSVIPPSDEPQVYADGAAAVPADEVK